MRASILIQDPEVYFRIQNAMALSIHFHKNYSFVEEMRNIIWITRQENYYLHPATFPYVVPWLYVNFMPPRLSKQAEYSADSENEMHIWVVEALTVQCSQPDLPWQLFMVH